MFWNSGVLYLHIIKQNKQQSWEFVDDNNKKDIEVPEFC